MRSIEVGKDWMEKLEREMAGRSFSTRAFMIARSIDRESYVLALNDEKFA